MSLEKKLGLAFVGILFLAFCGVLSMRLMNADGGPSIDINVAGVAPSTPTTPSAPQPFDHSPGAQNKPTFVAEQRTQPAAANLFAGSGGSPGTTGRTVPTMPAGAYGAAGAGTESRTSPNPAAVTTAPSTGMSSPPGAGYSTDSRYAASSPSAPAVGYGAPPTAMTPPPSFAPGAVAPTTSTAASGATGNPLRSAVPPMSGTSPAVASAPVSAASPNTISSPSNTAARSPYDEVFAAPNIGSTNMAASTSPPSSPMREPRPFDAGSLPAQPLAASTPSVAARSEPPATRNATSPAMNSTAVAPPQPPRVATLAPPAIAGFPQPSAVTGSSASAVSPASAMVPVASGRDQPYVVAPGETLFSISQKVYGDGSLYRALFAYNSDRYPHAEEIRSGNVLDVPPAEFLKQRYPDLIGGADATTDAPRAATAGGTYTVREGDTLFDIARKQLGQASRWTELYEANRATLGENLENLRPGVTLRLP